MDKRDIENFPKIRKKHKSKTTNFYENLEQKSQILGKFGRNPIDYNQKKKYILINNIIIYNIIIYII